jgi:holin-like protein
LPLLTFFLKVKLIRLEWVQSISDFLVTNIGFFFVPPGVAVMLYFDLIKAEWLPIVVATVISTLLVLAVTGWVHQLCGRHAAEENNEDNGKQA